MGRHVVHPHVAGERAVAVHVRFPGRDVEADVAEFRSRFVNEAEITGGLEHPGVVPVYGLGQYADGRPFYVMRFIRGDSLADALQRYVREHPEVRSVLFTGGDPMVMKTKVLRKYVEPLLDPALDHLESIRIGTKAPAYWPQRFVTDPDADDPFPEDPRDPHLQRVDAGQVEDAFGR